MRIRSDHAATTAPEPHTGLQGEGGVRRCQGDRRGHGEAPLRSSALAAAGTAWCKAASAPGSRSPARTQQAEVLCISRGSVDDLRRPVPDADVAIMRRLDRLDLEFLFAGSRMLRVVGGPGVDRPSACQNADAADGDSKRLSSSITSRWRVALSISLVVDAIPRGISGFCCARSVIDRARMS